jgi:hyperosmotically inducible periplasmic protein
MKPNHGKFVPVLATLLLGATVALSQRATAEVQPTQADTNLQAEVMNHALNKSSLKGVKATAQDGVVTLHGTVNVFALKEEADKRVHKIKGIQAVSNNIEIAGPNLPDPVLQQKLVKAISYDRAVYGTTPFNAISVSVQNGTAMLAGHAYGPVDASAAVSLAANTPGVKDVVSQIQVDPVSPMDDRARVQVFRTVYGFPMLSKYAMDPAKPIRISVQNGNVTLYGVVDSQTDKDVAGLRANTVPGVFSVKNDLQVAGAQERN